MHAPRLFTYSYGKYILHILIICIKHIVLSRDIIWLLKTMVSTYQVDNTPRLITIFSKIKTSLINGLTQNVFSSRLEMSILRKKIIPNSTIGGKRM